MVLAMGLLTLGLSTSAYAAIPTLDGMIGLGEWALADQFTSASDPNEGDIPDQYDIRRLLVQHEDSSTPDDGLYFRVDTFDDPTLVGGTNSFGSEAFVRVLIDFDGDVSPDLFLDFNDAKDPGDILLGVYTSPAFEAGSFIGYGSGVVGQFPGGVYEFFLPELLYNGGVVGNKTGFRVRLDNSGDEPDDSLPNAGFTTPIPEPNTILLLGSTLLGLLGLGGFRFRI